MRRFTARKRGALVLLTALIGAAACNDAQDRNVDQSAGGETARAGSAAASAQSLGGTGTGAAVATGAGSATGGAAATGAGSAMGAAVATGAGSATGGAAATGAGSATGGASDTTSGGLTMTEDGGAAGQATSLPCPFEAPDDPATHAGEILFDATSPCDQIGHGLVVLGDRLYWQNERDGRSYIASGSKLGGAADILVETDDPIWLFDARGVVAYEAGQRVFALSPASGSPVELKGAPICTALTSTAEYVYCRSSVGRILRWPATGGDAVDFAKVSPSGFELLADAEGGRLWFDVPQKLLHVPLSVIGGQQQPVAVPSSLVLHSLRIAPADSFGYWLQGTKTGSSDVVVANLDASAAYFPRQTLTGLRAALLTPLLGHGVVVASHGLDGSARLSPSVLAMTFDYRSNDGVVALVSDASFVYWLDRKGRVYRGIVAWPELDTDDAFSSTLDDQQVSGLSAADITTYCDELVAYADANVWITGRDRIHCIRAGVNTTVAECVQFWQACVDSGQQNHFWPPYLVKSQCVDHINSSKRYCDITVAELSACSVAVMEADNRYYESTTCERYYAGTTDNPPLKYRDCEQRCSDN
jgi:hypothetical protein